MSLSAVILLRALWCPDQPSRWFLVYRSYCNFVLKTELEGVIDGASEMILKDESTEHGESGVWEEINRWPSAGRGNLQECTYVVLGEWMKAGGKRDELLGILQSKHLNKAAEKVSSGMRNNSAHYMLIDQLGNTSHAGDNSPEKTLPFGR